MVLIFIHVSFHFNYLDSLGLVILNKLLVTIRYVRTNFYNLRRSYLLLNVDYYCCYFKCIKEDSFNNNNNLNKLK